MVWPFSGLATLVIQYIKAEDRVFYYFSLCVTILKATGGHKPPSSLIFTLTLLKALGIGIHTKKVKKTPLVFLKILPTTELSAFPKWHLEKLLEKCCCRNGNPHQILQTCYPVRLASHFPFKEKSDKIHQKISYIFSSFYCKRSVRLIDVLRSRRQSSFGLYWHSEWGYYVCHE